MSRPSIQIDTNLESPELRSGHDLYAVLSSALRARAAFERENGDESQAFWPADHFNLDQVTIFRDASEEEKVMILQSCGRDILEEAYGVEKCGMYFASKMSLLADSTQERMLYSLFASDEAVHFNWVSNYVSADRVQQAARNPFIKLLDSVLQNEDKLALTYVVQVILEGWGISHYRALSRDTTNAGLKKIFDQIIKDEARHHASGLILFNEQKPSSNQVKALAEITSRLLFMIQVGPQSIASQIERVKGHLSRPQKIRVFEELQCEVVTARKLDTLKALIRSAACAEAIEERLDRSGAFKPCSAHQCAAISS